MSKPGIFDKWITSLVVVAVLGVAAIGVYELGIKPGLPEVEYTQVDNGSNGGQDTQYEFPSIDSSSCVACHTNEAVIAASDWGKDQPVAENTGG